MGNGQFAKATRKRDLSCRVDRLLAKENHFVLNERLPNVGDRLVTEICA